MDLQYRNFSFDYQSKMFGNSLIIQADCLEWLGRIPENSIHGMVTDPPYGAKEYEFDQLEKRANGNGGIWRIPPSFDGNVRSPLPRFTVLNEQERSSLNRFFFEWGKIVLHALRPGGHVFLASNSILSQLIFSAISDAGLEYRGNIIRVVRTLRGGNRPKNAEEQYSDVCSMPRGCYEPWGIFRKPLLQRMKVSDCLDMYQTGGLRRKPDGNPFKDVIHSERTPKMERKIADHPSLKPQSFLRQLVYASLPLGEGIIVDPFMGSGSTVAAAEAVGYSCIGVERYREYYELAADAIPKLAKLNVLESYPHLSPT
ncbi:MAG: site-specific DNA-methyltransferase [Planctomycetes bacterium]|nr:site-specific DNA-methyltransferase [Planctomycetota bacterium]